MSKYQCQGNNNLKNVDDLTHKLSKHKWHKTKNDRNKYAFKATRRHIKEPKRHHEVTNDTNRHLNETNIPRREVYIGDKTISNLDKKMSCGDNQESQVGKKASKGKQRQREWLQSSLLLYYQDQNHIQSFMRMIRNVSLVRVNSNFFPSFVQRYQL